MTKMTGRLLALSTLLLLAACAPDRFGPPPYYGAQMAPPPLQPYVEPAVVPRPAATARRSVRRHYVRRHHYRQQVRCPCLPVR